MSFGARESRYARNVGPIACIRPLDGVPLRAVLSQLVSALGLPPDFCIMRRIIDACTLGPRRPVIASARVAKTPQRAAPPAVPATCLPVSTAQSPNSAILSVTQSPTPVIVFSATLETIPPTGVSPTFSATLSLIVDHSPEKGFQPPPTPEPACPPPDRYGIGST